EARAARPSSRAIGRAGSAGTDKGFKGAIFRRRACPALHREAKLRPCRPPPLDASAVISRRRGTAALAGACPVHPSRVIARRPRGVRGSLPQEIMMASDIDDSDNQASHTSHSLNESALYGYRPFSDEADPRPLPEERLVAGAIADMFDALISTMIDTRLEPDSEDSCWSLTNMFHRAGAQLQRELDDNENAQKQSQREQDGSEVRSVELERSLRE
ncbi:hypothetical protein OY671_009318, partial [Metschnikowia pulcherrima]